MAIRHRCGSIVVKRKGSGRAQRAYGIGVCPDGHGMMFFIQDSQKYYCSHHDHDPAPEFNGKFRREASKCWWTIEELEADRMGGQPDA